MDSDSREREFAPAPRREQTPGQGYWLISTLLLALGLGYALLIVEAFFVLRPEDFDNLVRAGMILPGYSAYVQELPGWIVALSLFKSATRIAGAAALLLRRRWAITAYGLSLAATCTIFLRGFLIDDRASFEGPAQVGFDVLFFALAFYALYFAIAAGFRGVLR
jgi:hypothetical protein